MRSKKPEEILKILKAAAIGDICFEHIIGFIKVGMTEKTVSDEIENTLMKLGCKGLAFPTIVVSGVRGALPHGEPTDKLIEDGNLVTMDFGGVYQDYCGDMTRTVAMSHVNEKQRRVYDLVLEAQLKSLSLIRSGVSSFQVDRGGRQIIENAGYGEYFIHGTGHGVGREVHEEPYLNTRTDESLEVDTAITVEPGIYIPGEMGVRIEDLAIVTEFGIINGVNSPKELMIL